MRTLATQYNISDVALAKWCKRMRVPVPGRGYWAKKAAGKKVRQISLPALPPNDPTVERAVTIAVSTEPKEDSPELPEPLAQQLAFEDDPANRIVVADSLRSSHPLVRATLDALEASAKNRDHHVRNWQARYLDIDVTGALFRRALRIADALVKGCERRGWKVTLGAGDDRKSYVTIFEQKVPFGIRETLKKVENEKPKPQRLSSGEWYQPYCSKHRDEPSGKLAFVIRNSWGHGVQKNWVETESRPLEERLNDFAFTLAAYAYDEQQRHLRFLEEERLRRAAEERRIEEQKRREREAAKQKELEQEAVNWDKSCKIKAYLAAVRETAARRFGQIDPQSELAQWLTWADAYANAIDPLWLDEPEAEPPTQQPPAT